MIVNFQTSRGSFPALVTALPPRLAGAGHARAVRGPDAEDAPRPPLLAIPTSTVTQVNILNRAQSNKLNHLDLKRLSKNTIDCAMPLF